MNSLVSIVSLLLKSFNPDKVKDVSDIAQEYFTESRFVTVITDNNFSFGFSNFSTPMTVYDISSHFNDTRVTPGVILNNNQEFNERILTGIKWNADTKFLILSVNNCSDDVINFLWKSKVCKLLALTLKNETVQFCSDLTRHCMHEDPSITEINYNKKLVIENYAMIPDVRDCVMNISFINLPPFVLWDERKGMAGNEGSVVDLAVRALGIKPVYINRHETGWGSFEPPTGLVGDVVTRRSYLGFGALYPFVERDLKGTILPLCVPGDMGWAVPAGAGPRHPTSIIILISEFSYIVWVATAVSYLFLIPLLYIFDKITAHQDGVMEVRTSWPFTVLQMILGVPACDLRSKTMMMTCILYGFLLTTMYKSLMSSKLTAPSKIPEITSSKELVDSNLFLTGPRNTWLILNSIGETNAYMRILADNFHINQTNAIVLLRQLVSDEGSAIFRHTSSLIYSSLTDPAVAKKVHIMEEKSIYFQTITLHDKEFCSWRKLRRKYLEICEAGLVSKWVHENSGTLGGGTETGPRKLTLIDIKGFIYMSLLSWGVSVIAFAGEVLAFNFHKYFKI